MRIAKRSAVLLGLGAAIVSALSGACGGSDDVGVPFDDGGGDQSVDAPGPRGDASPGTDATAQDATIATDAPTDSTLDASTDVTDGAAPTDAADSGDAHDAAADSADAADANVSDANVSDANAPDSSVIDAGSCSPDAATTLAPSQADAHRIAVDSTYVYWTDDVGGGGGKVQRVLRSGGAPELVAGGQNSPQAIAVDDNNAYWINLNFGTPGAVMKAPKNGDGGAVVPLVPNITLDSRDLAIDQNNVYWTENNGGFTFDAQVHRVAKGGGAASPVVTEKGVSGIDDIVTDGVFVYYVVRAAGGNATALRKAPVDQQDAGTPSILLAAGKLQGGLALRTGVLYWKDCSSLGPTKCKIYSLPVGGGTPAEVATDDTDYQSRLAVDDAYVYWTDWGHKTIYKALIGGGSPIQLSASESCPDGIAVDDAHVYWANFGCPGGSVRYRCK
jgi:hypothetical protein